jgi:peptide/nickel transport system substrate-binding protein
MQRTIFILVAFMIISSLIFIGCSSPTTPSTTTVNTPSTTSVTSTSTPAATSPTSQAISGGIFRFITGGLNTPVGWPPELVGADEIYAWPIMEALWWRDEQGTLQPWLATSWDIAPDGSSFTFHLRHGVKFHDGTEFNAQAVQWMLEEHKKVKVGGSSSWGAIEVIDDYTVKLNLTTYQNTQELVIGQIKFVSPTAYKENGIDYSRQNPLGTGPFKVKEFVRSVSLELERNPDYWGDKPYLNGIKFTAINDNSTKKSAFLGENYHAIFFASLDPQIAFELQQQKYNVDVTPLGHVFIYFDHGKPDGSFKTESSFADVRVRQAVEYAIDRNKIASAVGKGFWKPITQFCQPGMYGYVPDLVPRDYNPQKAKALLAEAGYPNGFKTIFTASTSTDPSYLDAIKSYLGAVGIEVEIKLLQRADSTQNWTGLWFANAGIWGFEVLERMQFHYGGNQNVSVYKSPEFKATLQSALSQPDSVKKSEMTQQLARFMYDDAMLVPVYCQGTTIISKNGVHGLEFQKVHTLNWWTFKTMWLEKDLQ